MAFIDKDLLLKDISESVVFSIKDAETSPELRGARKIIDRIENAPSADVVEVKHGYWKQNSYCKRIYYCSVCNRHIEDATSLVYEHFPYCHCGAKMDGTHEKHT